MGWRYLISRHRYLLVGNCLQCVHCTEYLTTGHHVFPILYNVHIRREVYGSAATSSYDWWWIIYGAPANK